MPQRKLATRELASLFGVLAHPTRVQLLEELGGGEQDVNTLAERVECTSSRVSQHLSQLKAHRLVVARRDGRHVYYRLTDGRLAAWVLEGLDFTEAALLDPARMREAMAQAREAWGHAEQA